MIKIKIDGQQTTLFVQAPNKILDLSHSVLTANIDSYYDKAVVSFYDVINEEAFDSKKAIRNDMSNLRLLSHKIFDVRDLPFDKQNQAKDFRILMPVEQSGNVASFTFNGEF